MKKTPGRTRSRLTHTSEGRRRGPGRTSLPVSGRRRAPRPARSTARAARDPLRLLQAHARDLDHLFERYERGRSELAKRRIFEDIRHELEVHMRTQEDVLYPACEAGAAESARARLAESRSEHQYLRSLLEDLSARREHDSRVQTEVADLRQDIARHMAVEESQLYVELQPRLAGEMVRDLGRRVHERLEELSSAGRSEARVGGGALSLGVDLLGIRL